MANTLKYILAFIAALSYNTCWAQTGIADSSGTCLNPYLINDSAFVINSEAIKKDKVWFTFVSNQREIYLKIVDENNQPCNYLVFKNTGENFCEEISNKALIPERNKVCDKRIIYDAGTALSYENINRGVCKCETCCLSNTKLLLIPGEVYSLVVYNPDKSIRISINDDKLLSVPVKSRTSVKQKETTINQNTDIEDIQVGQNITLENIYFEAGTYNILRSSYNSLAGLLAFLVKYPSVKIEIQGHINAPNMPLDINSSNNLGYYRARAVYAYLIEKKIDKNRLTYKGYGNTKMVYPNAIYEVEMAKNRRVEILILAK